MTPQQNKPTGTPVPPAKPATKPPPFHYHPDYGLPDDYRLRILADADTLGVPAAAALHRVSESCIYKWRKVIREAEEVLKDNEE